MALKDDPSPSRSKLLFSRFIAGGQIDAQIAEAAAFSRITNLDELKKKRRLWSDYTRDLLKSLFDSDVQGDEFDRAQHVATIAIPSPSQRFNNELDRIAKQLLALRSIRSRLDLLEIAAVPGAAAAHSPSSSRDIFLVHGHDEVTKEAVARFLGRLGLSPIILHEQADKGRTIIEKFEDHSNVGFAVVLLTPDDEGALRGSGASAMPRARQSVVLELGYFLGKLGRARVCALKADGVEEPSDLHGVLYVALDAGGAWRLTLGRELKAAGIDVDLNKAC